MPSVDQRPKRQTRDVAGILLLDKPSGLSSNQALQRAKHLFGARKAGHTGSLDPLATGLLPICFGEATKIAGFLLGSRKAYRAEVRLGATTTTDDSEGEVVAVRPVPAIDSATLESVLAQFRGRIAQVAPIYSAIKQSGTPLYARARRGETVQAPTRAVDIGRLDLVEHAGERLCLHVECGSGTYIRSLARDIGERLGCGAHLVALRRLWVEPFRAPVMWTLAQIEALTADAGPGGRDALLLPVDAGLAMLPALRLTAEQAGLLEQGRRFRLEGRGAAPLCRATGPNGELVALAEITADGEVRVRRGFNRPA